MLRDLITVAHNDSMEIEMSMAKTLKSAVHAITMQSVHYWQVMGRC